MTAENSHRRFPTIDLASASPAQRAFADEIINGPRKALYGPFVPLLHAPDLARRVRKIGEFLRFESSLPKDALECAILTVAKRWRSNFEWDHHAPLALKAGVPPIVVDGINRELAPDGFPEPHRLVVGFCRDALASGNVRDSHFGQAKSSFGLQGVLELLTVCGYYSTLAMYLGAAEISE
jgi:4-carboxymuconolactone decarboxylase